jgi:hypothetical protein
MVLACRALGLGTTLTNRHMFYQKEVDQALGLPDGRALLRHPPDRLSDGQVRPGQARAARKSVVYQDRWGRAVLGMT